MTLQMTATNGVINPHVLDIPDANEHYSTYKNNKYAKVEVESRNIALNN